MLCDCGKESFFERFVYVCVLYQVNLASLKEVFP